MNHGGIGYLSHRRLVLPIDLLRPLSIGDGSRVVALYYPPGGGQKYHYVPKCHDLMITPVPVRYWPVMGRLLVRLCHTPGTMAQVARWLQKHEICILNAECSRSAHRFATWNLTIAFESLIDQPNEFNPKTSEHVETVKALHELERDLENEFMDDDNVLFRDESDFGLVRAVEVLPIRTHSYFHNYIISSPNSIKTNPLELQCSHSDLQSHNDQLAGLLDQLGEHGSELAPTCVIAEMDTRDFNLRVAIIPPQDLHRFFEVVIPYRRTGGESTRGLIATVTESLASQYNLWRVSNFTSQNHQDMEVGETLFCLEDCNKGGANRQQRRRYLTGAIEAIRTELETYGPSHTKILPKVQVDPITPDRVRYRLIAERAEQIGFEYDVFISYGKRDGKRSAKSIRDCLENQGIRTHLDETELKPGEDWHQRLVDGVRKSGELAVVCTRRSFNRPWIAIEIGCAMGLGKEVTPILCGDIDDDEVPDYLKRFLWVKRRKDHNLISYSASVLDRLARARRF